MVFHHFISTFGHHCRTAGIADEVHTEDVATVVNDLLVETGARTYVNYILSPRRMAVAFDVGEFPTTRFGDLCEVEFVIFL